MSSPTPQRTGHSAAPLTSSHRIRSIALATLLGLTTLAAAAQGPMGGLSGTPPSAEQRAAFVAQRLQALKTQLAIRSDQEPAWTTFVAALSARPALQRPTRAELEAMTTPQRLDRMRELRNQRHAAMDQRSEAVRVFYGVLSAEQQRTFDTLSLRRFLGGHGRGPGRGGPPAQ